MFGSTLHNPLTTMIHGVYTIAFLMAAIVCLVGMGFLWSGRTMYAAYAVGGAVCASIVGIDLYDVINTKPVFLMNRSASDHSAFHWAHTSDTTILLSVLTVIVFGWLACHLVKRRMLLSACASVVGFVAAIVVAVAALALRFDPQSEARNAIGIVGHPTWDTLTVAIIGFVVIAMAAGVTRSVRHIRIHVMVRTESKSLSLLDDPATSIK
jgi:hypothetical protein